MGEVDGPTKKLSPPVDLAASAMHDPDRRRLGRAGSAAGLMIPIRVLIMSSRVVDEGGNYSRASYE